MKALRITALRPQAPARLACSVALLFTLGCGARPTVPTGDSEVVQMEEMVVEAKDGNIAAFDAQSLFEEATTAFQKHEFDECDAAYEKLLDRFPESRFAHSALYNRGLCLEQLSQHIQAAAHFRRHAQLAKDLKDRRDGEFRWGYNLVKAGDHPTAVDLYTRLLAAEDIGDADRAECHLRRGTALIALRRPGAGEKDLKKSMEFVRIAYDGVLRGNDLYAEAHYRRAEIYQALSHGVRLVLPISGMRDRLANKVKFFRQAQSSYIDSLNVQHAYWATAAGLRLGELYEQFYLDVMDADVPKDLSKEEKEVYFVELRKSLQPVLEQSLSIYEKNITMSQRLGAENEWVTETESRVARLRGLIEASERERVGEEQPQG